MYCAQCGNKIESTAAFCPSCGTPIRKSAPASEPTGAVALPSAAPATAGGAAAAAYAVDAAAEEAEPKQSFWAKHWWIGPLAMLIICGILRTIASHM